MESLNFFLCFFLLWRRLLLTFMYIFWYICIRLCHRLIPKKWGFRVVDIWQISFERKMSNYFFKVIWTFNLAVFPASQQWVRIPTALHPHPQCYKTYSIFVSLDIFVVLFSAFVIICFGMKGFLETTYAICEQERSQILWLFRLDLFCSEWVPWYFNSYCQNQNAPYSLSSWKIIQKLLSISSKCKV